MLKALVVIIVMAISSLMVSATPTGPDLGVGLGQRGGDPATGVTVGAQAGNTTSMELNSTALTDVWQGYFGNISGRITLDDSSGNTMYDWVATSISGEIYAANSTTTPAWDEVVCFNLTKEEAAQNTTLAELESALGSAGQDDRVNATFNLTNGASFDVGSSNTVGAGCSWTSLYVNDQWEEYTFNETILTNNGTTIIYTTLIENNQNGFQNLPIDFQMIVGDNGGITGATQYTFYIELS